MEQFSNAARRPARLTSPRFQSSKFSQSGTRKKGRRAGHHLDAEKTGASGGFFERLALEMLLTIWPADRITSGLAVCRFLRKQLGKAPRVILCTTTTAAASTNQDLLTKALLRFEGNLELRYRMGPHVFSQVTHAVEDANRFQWHGLVHLDCSGQQIGPAGALDLSDAVAASPNLESLRVRGCELHHASESRGVETFGMQMLLRSLRCRCRNLTVLDLADNQLTCVDLGLLCNRLAHPPGHLHILELLCDRLHTLDLANNHLSHVAGLILAHSMMKGASVKHLDLSQNDICERDVSCPCSLPDAHPRPSALTLLDVSSNRIGDEGAGALAAMLRHQASLRTLRLAKAGLTETGVGALAEGLGGCPRLERLDLSGNRVGDEGVARLVQGVGASGAGGGAGGGRAGGCSTSLSELTLVGSGVGVHGLGSLALSLSVLTNLSALDVRGNDFPPELAWAMGLNVKGLNSLQNLATSNRADSTRDVQGPSSSWVL